MQQLNAPLRRLPSRQEREAYYRTLFEASSDCILVLDADDRPPRADYFARFTDCMQSMSFPGRA